MEELLIHAGVYAAGFVSFPVAYGVYVYANYRRSLEDLEAVTSPQLPAGFVSRTTGEEFHTIAEAKAHARREQGWQPDGPGDDTWRQGFTVEPLHKGEVSA